MISWREQRPFDYVLLVAAMALTGYGLAADLQRLLPAVGGEAGRPHAGRWGARSSSPSLA